MKTREDIISLLSENNLGFKEHTVKGNKFPPESCFWNDRNLKRCKNLFFRDNHGKNHFLVVFDYDKKIDIRKLQEITGRGSLTMASRWRLEKYLGLKPGFISIFGILNDTEKHVKIILDKELDRKKELSFLPNSEGGSFISLRFEALKKFLDISGHEYLVEVLKS